MYQYVLIRSTDYNTFEAIMDSKESNIVYNNISPENRWKGINNALYSIHTSGRLNRIFKLPFQSIWSNVFLDDKVKDILRNTKDKVCFVFSEFAYLYENMSLFSFLRNNYAGCKIVYYLNNTVSTYLKANNGFSVERIKNIFDLITTYNVDDSIKYNIVLAPPKIYTYECTHDDNAIEHSDVFYVGSAKGRFNNLISVYEKLASLGLKCDFHIVGVEESDMKYSDHIDYNRRMNYEEVLRRAKRSKCILNINEQGNEGITLRDCEAVGMNKFLISGNSFIKEMAFFNPEKYISLYNLDVEIQKINTYKDKSWNNYSSFSVNSWYQWLGQMLDERR